MRAMAVIVAVAVAHLVGCSDEQPAVVDAPPAPIVATAALVPDPYPELIDGMHRLHVQGDQQLACSDCHRQTGDTFDRPGPDSCLGCHDQSKTGGGAATMGMSCLSCHDFQSIRGEPRDCSACHSVDGHSIQRCADCHSAHKTEGMMARDCTSCHGDRSTPHGGPREHAAQVCLDCHDVHQPGAAAARASCRGCHRSGRVQLALDEHEACTTCHRDHRFEKKAVARCQRCHDETALGADRVAEHQACASCHRAHDPRRSARAACASCHREAHTWHPNAGGDCVGCHDIHPERAARPELARTCSSCHVAAASDQAFHAGTTDCQSCHPPHGAAAAPTRTCTGCHVRQVFQLTGHPGHSRCEGCHEPHRPGRPVDCATCHTAQATTAPAGHADCSSCHEQHTRGRRAACASCHAEKTATPHMAVVDGCLDCHRPHGPGGSPSPRNCQSCHDPTALPSLHRIEKHQSCTDCHGVHQPTVPGRDVCLACHTEQIDHEPAAATCNGCHPFGSDPASAVRPGR